MIVYSYIKNSLLQAIIHRTKEGRILMEKIQENVTRKTDIPQAVITEAENDFIMLPIVDFCFKELMQNENVRKSIIAAILGIHPEEVTEAELMPTILEKEHEDDKYGVLDVRVKLKDGTQIDFEIRVYRSDGDSYSGIAKDAKRTAE